MHISDGVLGGGICAAGAAISLAASVLALKNTDNRDIPRISVMTAAFFAVSLIHIKLGPASVHFVLNGLTGIILGIYAFPAILIALVFQAVMFQHGGITTIGVNSLAMGLPAVLSFYLFRIRHLIPIKKPLPDAAAGFITGVISLLMSAFFIALFLVLTGRDFTATAKLIFSAHLPLAIAEGIATGFIVVFLLKVKPELLK